MTGATARADIGQAMRSYFTGNVDDTAYVPFEHPQPDGSMATFGEVNWVRTESNTGGNCLVGLWRTGPGLSPEYDFGGGDESFLVVKGSVTIELLETGEKVHFKEGDFASFVKGTRSRWHFPEDFVKFVVVTDDAP
jgi:uncharacterized cupin superfamily protein